MMFTTLFTLLLASLVVADTCRTIDQAYRSIQVAYPGSSAYSNSQYGYWNKDAINMTPTCIIFPQNGRDVGRIIDVFGTNIERFAIKSGGYMANVLYNE
jgi:hypothetical protein